MYSKRSMLQRIRVKERCVCVCLVLDGWTAHLERAYLRRERERERDELRNGSDVC